jgi:hypothetical protein
MVVRVLKGWGHLECRLALNSLAEQAAPGETPKGHRRHSGNSR